SAGRGVRRGARATPARGAPCAAGRRDLGAALRRGPGLRPQGAPGGRHDLRAGEAGGRISTDRLFQRSFEAIGELAGFTREVFRHEQIDQRILPTVDLAIEELFTNMVKYANGTEAAVRVSLEAVPGGVEVTLTDYGVERF